MNLTELNILLRDVSLSRKSVHEYQEGDVYQNLNSGEHKYGCINWTVNNVQVLDNTLVVNCYLFYIDRLLEDSSNKLSIWTVGSNTLHQILNAAKNSTDFFDYDNLTFTTFTEKFSDLCAGVYASCDIQILGNVSECDEEYIWRESAWDAGYTSGYTDGKAAGEEVGYNSGYTAGFASGETVGYDSGYTEGRRIGRREGYDSGLTEGYESGLTVGFESGYTIGFGNGYSSGYTDGYNGGWTDGYNSGFTAGQLTVGGGLEFTALEDGCAIAINTSGSLNPDLKYRVDNTPFAQWNYRQYEIDIDSGQTVYIKGDNPNGLGNTSSNNVMFVTTGKIKVGGNIAALLDNGTGTQTSIPNRAFEQLFQGTSIVDASDLQLSLVSQYAYSRLFSGCTSLVYAPIILPATTLATLCYNEMFRGCQSLTTAPVLPATTLGNSCYRYMFYNCKALTKAQDILPATTVMNNCYQGMFEGCSKLTDSPILPAETLVNACYSSMFGHCTSLTSVTSYAKDISATECLYYWVYDVGSGGKFFNLGGATYPSSASGIPTGWTKYRIQQV